MWDTMSVVELAVEQALLMAVLMAERKDQMDYKLAQMMVVEKVGSQEVLMVENQEIEKATKWVDYFERLY